MIDALPADQTETQLLSGFQKLGLDPAQVKTIVVGHGHADHFGGSAYFQEHYGTKVYISAADWELMEHPPAGRGKKKPRTPLPKHDQTITEGLPTCPPEISTRNNLESHAIERGFSDEEDEAQRREDHRGSEAVGGRAVGERTGA